MDNVTDIVGKRVKELREAGNFSQAELAKKIAVSPSQISKIETGKSSSSLEPLIGIADYFKVSLDYICGRTDEKSIDEFVYATVCKHVGSYIQQMAFGGKTYAIPSISISGQLANLLDMQRDAERLKDKYSDESFSNPLIEKGKACFIAAVRERVAGDHTVYALLPKEKLSEELMATTEDLT